MSLKFVETESGEPAFTIEDEEAVFQTLPECVLPAVSELDETRVQLSCYSATMLLPSPDSAKVMDVPESKWQGWEWTDGGSILLLLDRLPDLPKLFCITVPDASMRRVAVAGHPMCVTWDVMSNGEASGVRFAAEVRGFINDVTELWAQVIAPSVEGRDLLLAAVCSFALVDERRL